MLLRTTAARPRAGLLSLLAPLALVLAGCSPDRYPQTALRPLSDFARIGDDVQMTTFWWALGVFILVEGALLYAIFRFRGKPEDADPPQIHGNTTIEIIWTVIPALILAAIAVPTVKGIFETNVNPPGNALKIEVVGHQWWWEFRYPDYNVTTANELHIPVGQTVNLRMGTIDVVHSFWPPRFAGKRDVFPNRETRLWFKAEQPGFYSGQCAEFCGIQHGRMMFHIRASTPDEFQTWVKHMQTLGPAPAAAASDSMRTASAGASVSQGKPAPAQADSTKAAQNPAYATGEKLFQAKGCVACHSLVAHNAPKGMVGPNLANVGARAYIAAGTLKNDDANLSHWIREPQSLKRGVLMPNLGVTEEEAKSLVAYLRAHQ
jgi:cytochrome c oxidase subunit II